MKPKILKGPRVVLRPIKLSDAPDYVRWFKDKEVVQYLGNKLLNIKEKGVRDYFLKMAKSKDRYLWAIVADGGQHIGNISCLLEQKDKRVGLGIVIGDKRYWGRGFGPECWEVVANYIFRKLNFNRLQLTVLTTNSRAVKAYQKVGFKKEGVLRENIYAWVGKKFCDEYVMSILRAEWVKKYKNQ